MNTTPELKLDHSIMVTVNGETREIFMSFALLNRIAYLVGNPEQIGMLLLDPSLRIACLAELMAERTKTGKVLKVLDIEELDISLDDIEKALDWAAEHVLNFTLRVAEKSTAHALRHQDKLLNLTSTASGLANSALKKSAV